MWLIPNEFRAFCHGSIGYVAPTISVRYNAVQPGRCHAVTNRSSNPSQIIQAPEPSRPELHNTVLNVNCAEGEDVEWQWTETAQGRYVSGYRIVRIESDLAS
jgi:hypothetical protein